MFDNEIATTPLEESGYRRRIDSEDLWFSLRSLGLNHGPLFKNTTSIVQDGGAKDIRRCVTEIQIADCDSQEEHVLHRSTLDSVFISSYATLPGRTSVPNQALTVLPLKQAHYLSRCLLELGLYVPL